MAKKRTVRPFYGKAEQKMEAHARQALQRGNTTLANRMFEAVRAGERLKMFRHARMMSHRPIGAFLTVPKQVISFLRNYQEV